MVLSILVRTSVCTLFLSRSDKIHRFCRLSYGTGRPAVLKDDESIRDCRYLLNHPYAIEDDMRLVSTVELIAIRERVHNALSPLEGPVRPEHFEELHRADIDFRNWYSSWDSAFSRKYEDAGQY